MINTKEFIDAYITAKNNAFDTILDKTKHNDGVYTSDMLRALADMARHDVYPDSRFGDDECNIWSIFHTPYIK